MPVLCPSLPRQPQPVGDESLTVAGIDRDAVRDITQLARHPLGRVVVLEHLGPPGDFCVRVTPRVNPGSETAPRLIIRDSAQVATRIPQASCGPDFTNNLGLAETRDHCGATSIWDVASGGRMGFVTGEDATEVANPPTDCTEDCQAQNQVRGRLGNLGFPLNVPAGSRLTPRTSSDGLNAPLTAP